MVVHQQMSSISEGHSICAGIAVWHVCEAKLLPGSAGVVRPRFEQSRAARAADRLKTSRRVEQDARLNRLDAFVLFDVSCRVPGLATVAAALEINPPPQLRRFDARRRENV